MPLERTFRGLEANLKSSGAGRFSGAAFLALWLTIWTCGELFVLWILLWGGWSLLTGRPPGEGRTPLVLAPALATGLFLLVWLALWTLGGVIAWRELLRTLFGRDTFIIQPDTLEMEHGYGIFRARQILRREQLFHFYLAPQHQALSVITSKGTVELARLGSADERQKIVQALNAEFRLPPDSTPIAVLPRDWTECVSLEGEPILLKNPATRRKLGIAVGLVFLLFAAVSVTIWNATRAQLSLGPLAAIISLFAGLIGWGAYQLHFCRDEWVIRSGQLVLQKRGRDRVSERFVAGSMQLREDRDSDGDRIYRLVAIRAAAPVVPTLYEERHHQQNFWSGSGDPTELRGLGLWLSGRCSLPFSDQTTTEAKAQEFERVKQQLASCGRFGQWAAQVLEKIGPRRN